MFGFDPTMPLDDENNAANAVDDGNPDDNAVAAVDGVADNIKGQIVVPRYSGHPEKTSFQGEKGLQTELFSASKWARRIDQIKGAAGWTDSTTAHHAKLALLPTQPTGVWLDVNAEEPFMGKWSTMRPMLIAEFAVYIDASEKVEILRSFRQLPSEAVGAYVNRIRLNYQRFLEDLEKEWDPNETAVEAAVRKATVKKVTEYHLGSFFCLGLADSLLKDVTKSNKTSLEDMVTIAKQTERANLQAKKRHNISAVEESAAPAVATAVSPPAPTPAPQDEIIAFVRSQMNKNRNPGRGRGGQRSRGNRGRGRGNGRNLSCFYCFVSGDRGHYANECPVRDSDRRAGRYRNNINDPIMSQEEFVRLVQSRNPAAAANIGSVLQTEADFNAFSQAKN